MKNRIVNYLKLFPKHIWVLIFIIVAGIFFRTYNFHEWMQFNTDAFRDAILVSHPVLEGPGSLPLLGPRAGGTQLHLGPIFYYFQYLSGVIFQSTSPVIFAFPSLLFSILAIPTAFLFLRRYFSPFFATALAGMLSFSFMAIEYGRFAWNPNATPFFAILFSYALLMAYECDKSDSKKVLVWFAVSGSALAIASQLHFIAFLGLPIIFVLFAIINWKKSKEIFSWKVLLVFLGTIFIFYIPVIAFDFLTHGKNLREFLGAVGSKGDSEGIFKNIIQDAKIFSKYFLWIVAGVVDGKWWQEIVSGVFFFIGAAANSFLLYEEKKENKKRFLQFTLLLVLVYFVLFIPLAFEIQRSRFFLPILILPFILIGYVIVFVQKIGFSRSALFGGIFLIALLMANNTMYTLDFFSKMNESQNKRETSYKTVTEKDKSFWWTWGRFEKAADYMGESCEKNAIFFLMSKKTKDYDHSIEYALVQKNRNLDIELKNKFKEKYEDYDRCYFYISLAKEGLPDFVQQKKHDDPFFLGDMKITKWYPENATLPVSTTNRDPKERASLKKLITSEYPRLQWGDLF